MNIDDIKVAANSQRHRFLKRTGRKVVWSIIRPFLRPVVEQIASIRSQLEEIKGQVAALEAGTRERSDILARVEKELENLNRGYSVRQSTRDQARILEIAKLLNPKIVVGDHAFARFGIASDGGYVMLDDLSGIYGAISLGIGANASWDLQLAERGLMIKQFDHTIERSPVTHDNIRFDKIRISPQAGEACKTLEQIAEDCLHEGTGWILKADIEADEWPVFDAADPKALTIYSQIVCEFHNFRLVGQDSFYSQAIRVLQKLAAEFVPIHVHGNNFAGFSLVGNCPFPDVLEVTFANRSRYTFAEAERFFPTPLDRANNGPVADLILGNFRFGSSPLS